MYTNIDRVHRKLVSDEMVFGKDKFVFGVDVDDEALTMYRVKDDNSLTKAFWYYLYNIDSLGGTMTLQEFVGWALGKFTELINARYLDNDELDNQPMDKDELDLVAEQMAKVFWDWNDKQLKLGE